MVGLLAAGCDTDSVQPGGLPGAPVVTGLVVTDLAGNDLGVISDSVLAAGLGGLSGTEAPLADTFALPDLGFLAGSDGGDPGEEGPEGSSDPRISVLPHPTAAPFTLRLVLPSADDAALYLLPTVPRERSSPPVIRAGTLGATPEGFDGLALYAGAVGAPGTCELVLDPRTLGMDYGLYRFVLTADGVRAASDLLYAPCVEGALVGAVSCG